MISANVNRRNFTDVDKIVTRLLRPQFARAHLPAIFALQETRSWDVAWVYFFFGSELGLSTLVVLECFTKYRDHGDMIRDVHECLCTRLQQRLGGVR